MVEILLGDQLQQSRPPAATLHDPARLCEMQYIVSLAVPLMAGNHLQHDSSLPECWQSQLDCNCFMDSMMKQIPIIQILKE